MTFKKSLMALALVAMSNIAIAEQSTDAEVTTIEIPMVSDARVFSQFNDKYPAMVNYFTKSNFDDINKSK